MKILEEILSASKFHTFIGTSFGIDLLWFEALILRQLKKKNIKRVLLFGDADEISKSLEDASGKLHCSGNSYVLQPVKVKGRFHSKIFLFAGESKMRLYIGSGNLTRGGMGRNREVFEKWEISSESKTVPSAFFEIRQFFFDLIQKHIDYKPDVAEQAIQAAFNTELLEKPEDDLDGTEVWISPSELFSKLPSFEKTADSLKIVSPYFDEKGSFVESLVYQLKATKFEVITDIRRTNLTPHSVELIKKLGGTVLKIDPAKHKRQLHAKMIHAKGEGWSWGAIGSANASVAAWRGYNAECVVVRKDEKSEEIENLIKRLHLKELDEGDQVKIEKMANEFDEEDSSHKFEGPEIVYAEWVGLNRIQIIAAGQFDENVKINLFNKNRVTVKKYTIESLSENLKKIVFTSPPLATRDSANSIYFSHKGINGRHIAIHDTEAIASWAQKSAIEMERLQDLLGSDDFNPVDAEKLLNLFGSIIRKRSELKRENIKAEKKRSNQSEENPGSESEQPDIVTVDLENLQDSVSEGQPKSNYAHAGALSSRMMNKLLFGVVQEDIDEKDSESELEEDSAADSSYYRVQQHSEPKCSHREKESFIKAAKNARKYYVKNIKNLEGKTLYNRFDDLQILTAPLHYMLLGEGISTYAFREEMIQILKAFIGGVNAPLPTAMADLDEEVLTEMWKNSSVLTLILLLFYNTCLADQELSFRYNEPDIRFANVRPVLWLRHILRNIPEDLRSDIESSIVESVPKLKWGIFWIGDKYPVWMKKLPFEEFVKAMLKDSKDIDRVDNEFDGDGLFQGTLGKGSCQESEDEDEPVVTRPFKGGLGIGWVEGEMTLTTDGAFQVAQKDFSWDSMRRSSIQQAVPLKILYDRASANNNSELIEGLTALSKISP